MKAQLTHEDYEKCNAEHARFWQARKDEKAHEASCKICKDRFIFGPRVPGSVAIQWHPKKPGVRIMGHFGDGCGVACAHFSPEEEAKISPEGEGYAEYIFPKKPIFIYLTDYSAYVSENPEDGGNPLDLCEECKRDLHESVADLLSRFKLRTT